MGCTISNSVGIATTTSLNFYQFKAVEVISTSLYRPTPEQRANLVVTVYNTDFNANVSKLRKENSIESISNEDEEEPKIQPSRNYYQSPRKEERDDRLEINQAEEEVEPPNANAFGRSKTYSPVKQKDAFRSNHGEMSSYQKKRSSDNPAGYMTQLKSKVGEDGKGVQPFKKYPFDKESHISSPLKRTSSNLSSAKLGQLREQMHIRKKPLNASPSIFPTFHMQSSASGEDKLKSQLNARKEQSFFNKGPTVSRPQSVRQNFDMKDETHTFRSSMQKPKNKRIDLKLPIFDKLDELKSKDLQSEGSILESNADDQLDGEPMAGFRSSRGLIRKKDRLVKQEKLNMEWSPSGSIGDLGKLDEQSKPKLKPRKSSVCTHALTGLAETERTQQGTIHHHPSIFSESTIKYKNQVKDKNQGVASLPQKSSLFKIAAENNAKKSLVVKEQLSIIMDAREITNSQDSPAKGISSFRIKMNQAEVTHQKQEENHGKQNPSSISSIEENSPENESIFLERSRQEELRSILKTQDPKTSLFKR